MADLLVSETPIFYPPVHRARKAGRGRAVNLRANGAGWASAESFVLLPDVPLSTRAR
jgi:hypothetical protein